jgi:putative component of membrane protein insertase Oxa1/YidC/SpoIIIJ protein YidD
MKVEMRSLIHALRVVLALLILSSQASPALAAEDFLHGPWDSPAYRSPALNQGATKDSISMTAPVFTSLLTFFSAVISPVDGDRCPSHPTCAAYSKQAYQKHGALVGTLMTVDRLIHEADEHKFSPRIEVYGVKRIYDPLSANELWKRQE